MVGRRIGSNVSALSQAWAVLHLHWRALMATRTAHGHHYPSTRRVRALLRKQRPMLRIVLLSGAGVVLAVGLTCGFFVWRLATGPLAVDVITPWLTSAIEERFGGRNSIEVGGTQLERDESGHTALRLRDIVVRAADGTVVATAPKAEVGISAAGLLTGQLQAVRLSLIGAGMAVRVEEDGQLSVFAGADKRPIASAPAIVGSVPKSVPPPGTPPRAPASPEPAGQDVFAALLTWLEGLDVLGLDGRDLSEIGLKNGSLVVDDRRSGKQWKFDNINLTLTRPKEGGVALAVSSGGTDGPWSMTATVTPRGEGRRAIEAVFRDISPKDILLALRMDRGPFEADMPLSAIVRAELAADGTVNMAEGRIVIGAGVVARANDTRDRLLIDEARIDWRWDVASRAFVMPVEVQSGANRLSLFAQLEPPAAAGAPWNISVARGRLMLASQDRAREAPLVLDRIQLRGQLDTTKRRLEIAQADFSGMMAGVALSGALDYSGEEPRLSLGLAATRMSVSSFKRLWPIFVAPDVRSWVLDHVPTGTVERVVIATNASVAKLSTVGVPLPKDGFAAEIVLNGSVRPIATLPEIREADLVAQITGKTAKVTLGRGTVDMPSGRKLRISSGVFEVPDTHLKPAPARARFHVDGQVDAAAELVAMEPLRGVTDIALDPTATHGTIAADAAIDWPIGRDVPSGSIAYNVEADITNLAVDRLAHGLKAESGNLHVSAGNQGVQAKGDIRIGGSPASVDYRKAGDDTSAELRVQTVLDDAARARLGLNVDDTVTGPVPVKISGRLGESDGGKRLFIDADFGQAKITELLPGWVKPAGKPVRATFTLVEKGSLRRFEDLQLEGSGTRVRGTAEFNADGDLVSANFPTFALSDGDKATFRAERGGDGTLKVTFRGDVYDGRSFVKSVLAGPQHPTSRRAAFDLDLDVKLGAVAGFNGEALRGLDLHMSRRAGEIRSFALGAKLGRDASLMGDLRARGGRTILNLETADAGALFRFTDMYPRMVGGQMWVEMDPPAADHRPSDGILSVRDFLVSGEPALDRMASGTVSSDTIASNYMPARQNGVQFSRMRMNFTRSTGRLIVRDGVVSGPAIGATIDGQIDFQRDDVRLRGTLVPAYALNNIPAQLPILGVFLGGGRNEGFLGVTYEVVGRPNAMVLRVNPMSAVAPGFLRKLFEFRNTDDQAWTGTVPRRPN